MLPLLLVGVKLSQIHGVWSLTHVPVSVSCAWGTDAFIWWKGTPAGSAAESLGGAAGLGSVRVCWWWGASRAAEKGRPLVCAGDATALEAPRCPWPLQALSGGGCHQTPGPAASGLRPCSAVWGWPHPGRTADEAGWGKWSPARRSPCCSLCVYWWVRNGSSLTGPACTEGDCYPVPETCLQTVGRVLPGPHSLR